MSKTIKWLSISLFVLFFALIGYMVYDMMVNAAPASTVIPIIIIFLALISVFCFYPQYVISNEDGIGIHSLVHTKWIKYDNIDRIEKADVSGSVRLFGISGIFGRIGYYRNSKLGVYISYVTDKSKAFVVYRNNGKPVAFSIDDPDSFLPYFLKN